jgi:hypothetical protein
MRQFVYGYNLTCLIDPGLILCLSYEYDVYSYLSGQGYVVRAGSYSSASVTDAIEV